ncbi:helix-turn-helix domain-containing protein [Blastopirellula marina]|nr:helix-turn-helix domain-containing protein [Blastopirellula marina]
MSSLDAILSQRDSLSMGVDSWEMYCQTPNWQRERMMAVNHFHDPGGQFEIAEVLLSEAIDDGDPGGMKLLSLLLNSGAKHPLELDMGLGKYHRPNRPGSIVFVSDQLPSEIQGVGPFHSIAWYIRPDVLQQRASRILGREAPAMDVLHSKSFRDDAIEVLLKRLLHQFESQPAAGARMTADDLVDDLIRRLLALTENQAPAPLGPRDRLRPASIQRTLEYLHANFSQDVSRDDLAQAAGVDPCHFTRLFRQTMGQTPSRYLSQVRIEHAKHLLRYGSSELTLNEISARCGFYNQSHMGREFRRQVGTTPNLYRVYS